MKSAMFRGYLPRSVEEAPRRVDENRGVSSTESRKIGHGLRGRLQFSFTLTTTLSLRPFQARTFPIWEAHLFSWQGVGAHWGSQQMRYVTQASSGRRLTGNPASNSSHQSPRWRSLAPSSALWQRGRGRRLVKLMATSRRSQSFRTSAARAAISLHPTTQRGSSCRANPLWRTSRGTCLSTSALPAAHQVDTGRHLEQALTHSKQRMGAPSGCHTIARLTRA